MRQIDILPQLNLQLTYRQLPGVSRNRDRQAKIPAQALFRVVLKDGEYTVGFELFPALQESELDHESTLDNLGAELGNQLCRRCSRAAGGN